MQVTSLEQAHDALHNYYSLAKKQNGDDSALSRMLPLLEAAGNPHERLKVVHVAGTSGKTSTCYYLSALLCSSGKKVGLTVSPYVDTILERIQLDGLPISEAEFCDKLSEFLSLIKNIDPTPGYFEVMVAFALWFFDRVGVDYVVLETGIGGMYDSTNVINRNDKICVITDIGMDHMQILGNTIEKIAAQKAGIIQRHNDVFMYRQSDEVMSVIHARVSAQRARLYECTEFVGDELSKTALYQQRNWHLSMQVYEYIASRDHLHVQTALKPEDVSIPGRMQEVTLPDDTLLIYDGAHNAQKMKAFVESFQAKFPGQMADVLVAFKDDKAYEEVLAVLKPITTKLYATNLDHEQGSHKSGYQVASMSVDEIVQTARYLAIPVEGFSSYTDAFSQLLKSPQKYKIVTGSLYLLGLVRELKEHA